MTAEMLGRLTGIIIMCRMRGRTVMMDEQGPLRETRPFHTFRAGHDQSNSNR